MSSVRKTLLTYTGIIGGLGGSIVGLNEFIAKPSNKAYERSVNLNTLHEKQVDGIPAGFKAAWKWAHTSLTESDKAKLEESKNKSGWVTLETPDGFHFAGGKEWLEANNIFFEANFQDQMDAEKQFFGKGLPHNANQLWIEQNRLPLDAYAVIPLDYYQKFQVSLIEAQINHPLMQKHLASRNSYLEGIAKDNGITETNLQKIKNKFSIFDNIDFSKELLPQIEEKAKLDSEKEYKELANKNDHNLEELKIGLYRKKLLEYHCQAMQLLPDLNFEARNRYKDYPLSFVSK